jgi:hypothetical protein
MGRIMVNAVWMEWVFRTILTITGEIKGIKNYFSDVVFYFQVVNAVLSVQYIKLKHFLKNSLYLLKLVVYLHPKQRGIEQ